MKKVCLFLLFCLLLSTGLYAQVLEMDNTESILKKTNERKTGTSIRRTIEFVLTDKRNKQRVQEATAFRKEYETEKKSVIFYTKPKNVEGTAVLTYDYDDEAKADDQWLYLPAMRKVRRISSANRGDYFLGTDLSYDDMKHEWDVSETDYNWKTLGIDPVDEFDCYHLEGIPASEKIASELKYSKGQIWIDKETYVKRRARFWDLGGNLLKTIHFNDITTIDGILTAQELFVENHKTGHKTLLRMSDFEYNTGVDDDIFTERALTRGL